MATTLPDRPGRAFASALLARSSEDRELVIPRLWMILRDPRFAGFNIEMPPARTTTHSDGWFHPSTHPGWQERLLVYYLRSGDPASGVRLVKEVLEPSSTMAIYQGHWVHAFLQHLLAEANIVTLVPGRKGKMQVEVPVKDPHLRSRGHMDGLLNSETLSLDRQVGLEIKSMGGWRMGDIPKGGPSDPRRLAWLVGKSPAYYLQAQEYMRMHGHSLQCLLFVSPGFPFDMTEIHVPFDPTIASTIVDKYTVVRKHHAEGTLPDPCCSVGSPQASSCPARYVCPIGVASASIGS